MVSTTKWKIYTPGYLDLELDMELAIAQVVYVQVHAQDPCGTGWVINALGLTYFRAAGRLALEVTIGTHGKGMWRLSEDREEKGE